MWLSKKDAEEYSSDKRRVLEKEEELDKLIAECQEIKEKPQSIKFSPVEPLKEDEESAFWNSISDILDNRHFQIFMYSIREKLFSQFGASNSEETAGGIQGLQIMLNEMGAIKQKYMDLLQAEENAKRGKEGFEDQ